MGGWWDSYCHKEFPLGQSGPGPCCEPGYTWCTISDWEKRRFSDKYWQRVQAEHNLWTFHLIMPQETLCCKLLRMDHGVVVRTVNFFWSRGLNWHQFHSLLTDKDITCGPQYSTEVRWLSRGAVPTRFSDLKRKLDMVTQLIFPI